MECLSLVQIVPGGGDAEDVSCPEEAEASIPITVLQNRNKGVTGEGRGPWPEAARGRRT